MFELKFMDGTPVPDSYSEQISRLVSTAANADVTEFNEDAVRDQFSLEGGDHE